MWDAPRGFSRYPTARLQKIDLAGIAAFPGALDFGCEKEPAERENGEAVVLGAFARHGGGACGVRRHGDVLCMLAKDRLE